MSRTAWTQREVEILQAMVASNRILPEIRRVLKSRNDAMIRNKAYDLGLKILCAPVAEIDEAEFKRLMGGMG